MTAKNKKLLDSHAVLKFLRREEGSEALEQLFRRAAAGDLQLLMSEINLREVYHIVLRAWGETAGEEILSSFLLFPIERVGADFDLVLSAARLKAELPVSYADCFAIATTMKHGASIVTGDPDFKRVENRLAIVWV